MASSSSALAERLVPADADDSALENIALEPAEPSETAEHVRAAPQEPVATAACPASRAHDASRTTPILLLLHEAEQSFLGKEMRARHCINCGGFLVHNIGEAVQRNVQYTYEFCIVCSAVLTEAQRRHAEMYPKLEYSPPELHECDTRNTHGICQIPHIFRYRPHPYASMDTVLAMYAPHVRTSVRRHFLTKGMPWTQCKPLTLASLLLEKHVYNADREKIQLSVDSLRVHWLLKRQEPPTRFIERLMEYDASRAAAASASAASSASAVAVAMVAEADVEERKGSDDAACGAQVRLPNDVDAAVSYSALCAQRTLDSRPHLEQFRMHSLEDICKGCNCLVFPYLPFYERFGLDLFSSGNGAFCTSCMTGAHRLNEESKQRATQLRICVSNLTLFRSDHEQARAHMPNLALRQVAASSASSDATPSPPPALQRPFRWVCVVASKMWSGLVQRAVKEEEDAAEENDVRAHATAPSDAGARTPVPALHAAHTESGHADVSPPRSVHACERGEQHASSLDRPRTPPFVFPSRSAAARMAAAEASAPATSGPAEALLQPLVPFPKTVLFKPLASAHGASHGSLFDAPPSFAAPIAMVMTMPAAVPAASHTHNVSDLSLRDGTEEI